MNPAGYSLLPIHILVYVPKSFAANFSEKTILLSFDERPQRGPSQIEKLGKLINCGKQYYLNQQELQNKFFNDFQK
jgi:hypothetical protein